jgi:tetratricopeptide (TPR) repeat protein
LISMKFLRDSSIRNPKTDTKVIRESDQLLEAAREALAAGDADFALEALRDARQLTPMRGEIRQLAERAIDMRTARLVTRRGRKRVKRGGTRVPAPPSDSIPTKPMAGHPDPLPSKERKAKSGRPASAQERPRGKRSPISGGISEDDLASDLESGILPGRTRAAEAGRRRREVGGRNRGSREAGEAPMPPPRRVRMNPSRGLNERRLPRLNLLAWLGVAGVAGMVMIGSSAILHTGTTTLYEGTSRESAVSASVPEGLTDLLEESGRQMSSGEPLRAVSNLQLAMDRWPEQKETISPVLAQAYLARGRELRVDRRYESAAEAYGKAAELMGLDVSARVAQADCLHEALRTAQTRKDSQAVKKFYGEALEAVGMALAVKPTHPEALLVKSKIHAAQNERKEQVACYEAIIKYHPDSDEAQTARRNLEMLKGN